MRLPLPCHTPQLRGMAASSGEGSGPFDAAASLLRNVQPPEGRAKYCPVYALLKEATMLEVGSQRAASRSRIVLQHF